MDLDGGPRRVVTRNAINLCVIMGVGGIQKGSKVWNAGVDGENKSYLKIKTNVRSLRGI